MKTPTCPAALLSILIATSAAVLTVGCQKNEPAKSPSKPEKSSSTAPSKGAIVSAEKNSFQEVTAHLDPGGSLYLYLGTEQWMAKLSQTVSDLRHLAFAIPDLGNDRDAVNKGFDIAARLIKNSGLENVSGLGASSIAREPGFYHSKVLLHHYPGQASGYIWSVFGQKAHPLDGLDLLPASTALAGYSDFDAGALWTAIRNEVARAGFPAADEALRQAPAEFEKMTGLKLDQVFASLGGEFGLVLTLDDTRRVPIPTPAGPALEIPEPGLLLFAKVKDDLIFNRIDKELSGAGQAIKVDRDGLRMRTMPLPLPVPITLRPTLARFGDYLLFASTDQLIEEAVAVKTGKKPGVKSSAEFKRLSTGVPAQGNSFVFVGQRLGETVLKVQKGFLSQANAEAQAGLAKLMVANPGGVIYAVGANTDEGWLMTGNGNQSAAPLLAGPVVVGTAGLLAAIAIPNFVKARTTAQKNACIANLKQIDGATQQWALENKKRSTDRTDMNAIKEYLKGGRLPACPAGGEYSVTTVMEGPTCSVPGHSLTEMFSAPKPVVRSPPAPRTPAAQKFACINNLKQLDGAVQQWALENKKTSTSKVDVSGIKDYLRGSVLPICPAGGSYSFTTVADAPKCTVAGHSL
jgi:competence protein ComGC